MTPAGEKAKKQVNVRKCPKCGAKPGQTCFVLTADEFIELNETHTTRTAKQSQEDREAAKQKKLNGGLGRRLTPATARRRLCRLSGHQRRFLRQPAVSWGSRPTHCHGIAPGRVIDLSRADCIYLAGAHLGRSIAAARGWFHCAQLTHFFGFLLGFDCRLPGAAWTRCYLRVPLLMSTSARCLRKRAA